MQAAPTREDSSIDKPAIERLQISDADGDLIGGLRPGKLIAFYDGARVQAIMLHPDDFARIRGADSKQYVPYLWDDVRRALASVAEGLTPEMSIEFHDRRGNEGILVHPAGYELLRASALLRNKAVDFRMRLAENSHSDWSGSLDRLE
jgi:hypothetical protein